MNKRIKPEVARTLHYLCGAAVLQLLDFAHLFPNAIFSGFWRWIPNKPRPRLDDCSGPSWHFESARLHLVYVAAMLTQRVSKLFDREKLIFKIQRPTEADVTVLDGKFRIHFFGSSGATAHGSLL
jgi:hypothetical protein